MYRIDSRNTPIKGGGGALTFFSQNSWTKVANLSYCSEFDATAFPDGLQVTSDGFDSDLPSPFSGPWQIYTHPPKTQPDGNGVALKIDTSQGCPNPSGGAGTAGKTSVTITVLNATGFAGFYKNPLPTGSHVRYDKRFHDLTPSCLLDEDVCERMAYIKTPMTGFQCPAGDCSFTIGPVTGVLLKSVQVTDSE